jgi:hypothetical protein
LVADLEQQLFGLVEQPHHPLVGESIVDESLPPFSGDQPTLS